MSKYHFKKAEQETHIRWDAEERIAHIYTANPADIRKLDKLAEDYPEEYKCVWADGKFAAKKYEVDAKHIRFRKPASQAQREAAKENGRRNQFYA